MAKNKGPNQGLLYEDRGLGMAWDGLQGWVRAEDGRQCKKWGYQVRTAPEWVLYLTEEVGELAQAVCEHEYRDGPHISVVHEAIQVATLALKIALMFDRGGRKPPRHLCTHE